MGADQDPRPGPGPLPGSRRSTQVADLFRLPAAWAGTFGLVVEIRTLQSLPLPERPDATAAIAATVRPGGRVFVRCLARGDDEAPVSRPWPVSHGELGGFSAAGLRETEFADPPATPPHGRLFTAVYSRPGRA